MGIILLKNETFGKYKTIWEEDKDLYYKKMWNEKLFKQYDTLKTRWEIVDNDLEVKEILEDKFSSKDRGDEYEIGLPSSTVIADTLFPVDLNKEVYKLSWLNNVSIGDHDKQEEKNKESLSKGTWVHKIIELYLISPLPKNERNIDDLIKLAKDDKEIRKKIPDIDDKIVEYSILIHEVMPQLIKEVLCKYDVIGCEVYVNVGNMQGSVDLLAKRDGKYYIIDWKTSSRIDKKTQKRKFSCNSEIGSYKRQLCLYALMLIKLGYIPESEKYKINFRLYQVHLKSFEHKEFKLENSEILEWEDKVKYIINWYWKMKGNDKNEK